MTSSILREFMKRSLGLFGMEVHRIKGPNNREDLSPRCSLVGVLQRSGSLGLCPATVLDVGAAYGKFTTKCYPETTRRVNGEVSSIQEYIVS